MGWLGFGSLNTYQNLSHSYLQKILCFHFHMVLSDFIWSKIELWLTPQKCKLLRTMWVSLVGTLLVILSPSFKKTNCGPLHTIKPQTFSICTVLDGFLAWVSLTLMNIRYSETTFVTQRKVEMTISWFLHTTLIEIS